MSPLLQQAILSGLLVGAVYALVAVGLNIIYGVLDIINFAHGAMMMVAMYITYWLFVLAGIDPYASALVTGPVLFLFGVVVYRYLLDPMRGKATQNQFLVTLGLSLVLVNLAQVLFKADFRTIEVAYRSEVIRLGAAALQLPKVLTCIAAVVAVVALFWLFQRTRIGKAIRATAQNQDGAALSGIDVRKMYTIAFGLGAMCVGIAGSLVTPFFYIAPHVGDLFNIASFVVVVLGGLGSMFGALLGGLILGVAESLGAALLPGSLKEVVMFVIFLGVLFFKPTGLMGQRG